MSSPRPHWLGTLLYVPLLYGLGWLLARPLAWLAPAWRPDQVNLAGAAIALLLLVCTLPLRLRRVWGETLPWRRLGLAVGWRAGLRSFSRGLLKALLLLGLVVTVLLLGGQARWQGSISTGTAANTLALLLGVGFAEELLFRGWLWGELELQLPERAALLLQAALFGLVHPWYRMPGLGAVGLLGGLVLLGLALALQRRADHGALWGAVGLHGGLVGGWFALQAGLIELAVAVPDWLEGPGGPQPNPIGGVLGWLGLLALLLARRRFWSA
ncbi:MAG: CPBP family glutamic-type intramembrane protease [Prochlorococcaceae cyanobacterium]